MIYNQTSIKYVIAKVLADNDMQEDTLRVNDLIEWSAEAMERIGAFLELEHKVSGKGGEPLLEISNYQTSYPTGLHTITQVAYSSTGNAPFYPMRMSSGSFDSIKGMTTVDNTDPENPIYDSISEVDGETSYNYDYTYITKPGYIVTNQQDGYILLSYTSIPLDEDGYPLVPNDPGFIDALYWYLTMKLMYPKWVLGEVRDAVYYNARQSWNFYSKQAYGNSMMPNPDMMESIKNTWNRLIPEMGDNNNFFSSTGQRQEIYNQTNENYVAGWNFTV